MTPTTLRELLTRLDRPFDVDALSRYMAEVRRTALRERDGLRERVPRVARELREATAATRRRAEEVEVVDERTRGGFVGTLLSSVDSEAVAKRRANAARVLAGDLAVLERRMADARVLAQQNEELIETAAFGVRVLGGLGSRAAAAEVDPAAVATIGPAEAGVAALPGQLHGVAIPLEGPLQEAEPVARYTSAVLASLRSSGRAATVGEALLDGMVSPESGALGQEVRRRTAEAAPGWVPELDREELGADEAAAGVESTPLGC